ncbi:hypothetical protein SAMN02745136_00460 [Anaerocolumna jejuensis DSM 15929]|uniref:Uncharacterized protein n=1 Tax=Anaerocolumna jejuensis DSM 15929 TaxID=1121322 RepID=A0A1M6KI48_9FIRM|nr:hypothetical protein [Anaerocolumna jejuensis]SHJ58570.1 hypothetical protein SAMN02745136_00460 [Anaerocolumna jejuensis DSM 15929]
MINLRLFLFFSILPPIKNLDEWGAIPKVSNMEDKIKWDTKRVLLE